MTNQSTKISDTMKNFKILAMTLCCILAMGFAACSDDDDAVKTALKDPALSNVSESVSSLTFSWDKVDNATQYGYELVDEAGEMVATDVTKGTSVKFTGLKPATTYTLSVWAYAPLYGEMSTSKIATLTGTTAATEPLAAPRPEATVAAGVVTVTWEEVPHATSYVYSYPVLDKATAETNIVTGETSDTSVTIEGLDLTAHTFTVYATSTDEAYTDSPEATVSFTISHDELYTVTGKYTSAHLGQTFDVTMVAYDDNTYTLFAWYGVDYYNFDFSVNADGVIVPNSSYALNSLGDYIIPTGVSSMPEVYISSTNSSTFTGNKRQGEIHIYTCNYESGVDTFVWSPSRQELWRATGTYSSHINGKTYNETLIAYDDGSYTLEPWYGVDGYNLEFKIDNGQFVLTEYYGIYDAGYWVNTGLTGDDDYGFYIWAYDNYCRLEGNRLAGTLTLYTESMNGPWGEDVFTWGTSGRDLTIDDLVGEYNFVTKGQEYLTDYTNWYTFEYDGTYKVTKSADDPNSLVFDYFYWYDYPVTGKVDMEAKTITFQPQSMGYYLFASSDGPDVPVVATFDENLVITFTNWNCWYDFGADGYYYYFYDTSTVFSKI